MNNRLDELSHALLLIEQNANELALELSESDRADCVRNILELSEIVREIVEK